MQIDKLSAALRDMDFMRVGEGADSEHYSAVAAVLMEVITAAVEDASQGMVEGRQAAHPQEPHTDEITGADSFRSTMDCLHTAIVMIDRDLVVTYVNKSTMDLLGRHAETFCRIYPGFSVESIVGTCIDTFQRVPSQQRSILSQPRNSTWTTDVQIDHLTFHLNVSARFDGENNHVGHIVEWCDVTERRAREAEVARLQSAIEGSESCLMLCDEKHDIVYANPAVVGMLESRVAELSQVFPNLDPHHLVGTSIDTFRRPPGHEDSPLWSWSQQPVRAEIELARLNFSVSASVILDSEGKYAGNMVEWRDLTQQKEGQRQIQGLIDAAAEGDLDRRVDASRFTGFMQELAEGINIMIDSLLTEQKEGERQIKILIESARRGELDERLDVTRYKGFMVRVGEDINLMIDTFLLPIRDVAEVMRGLAHGDLTKRMGADYEGEFGRLGSAVNTCADNLFEMVQQIRTAAGNIAQSSGEISQGNTDLSQRTEEQASSLEETAASMEQLTSTVQQNAENARLAEQLASGARLEADKGGQVVGQAIEAMAAINDSSKKIADIIGVIDEIAFQTNLLALNAAVEAARAGEQGRGFAVVASEVRSLAQRSSGAAKEITALIKDSVERVGDGSKYVNESGTMLQEIVSSVKKVSDIISEIAAASEEQSTGIQEVNAAVAQMDQMSQQNAALVEQAAAASESLTEEAGGMRELVGFFQLGEDLHRPVAPVEAAPKRPAAASAPLRGVSNHRPKVSGSDVSGDVWEEF